MPVITKEEIFSKIRKDSPYLNWLPGKTIFLARSGSHSYGTNIESSDEDFKGVTIPTKEYLFGSKIFEQAERKDPDLVIYDIKKFFHLAIQNNPNIIELLFTDPSDYLVVDSLGKKLIENRDLFLSKRVKFTFSGYAVSQLKRMKFHHEMMTHPLLAPPKRSDYGLPEKTVIPKDQLAAAESQIVKKLENWNTDFLGELTPDLRIAVANKMSEQLAEMKINSDQQYLAAARSLGYDENFIHLLDLERRYNGKLKEWQHYQEWKKNRNPARAILEKKCGFDSKNAYHLVRLLRMAKEITTTGKVFVKRPDAKELIEIRNGSWSYEQITSYAENMDKELDLLYKTCDILPKSPNNTKLDELCIDLVEQSTNKYSWYNIKNKFYNVKK